MGVGWCCVRCILPKRGLRSASVCHKRCHAKEEEWNLVGFFFFFLCLEIYYFCAMCTVWLFITVWLLWRFLPAFLLLLHLNVDWLVSSSRDPLRCLYFSKCFYSWTNPRNWSKIPLIFLCFYMNYDIPSLTTHFYRFWLGCFRILSLSVTCCCLPMQGGCSPMCFMSRGDEVRAGSLLISP